MCIRSYDILICERYKREYIWKYVKKICKRIYIYILHRKNVHVRPDFRVFKSVCLCLKGMSHPNPEKERKMLAHIWKS